MRLTLDCVAPLTRSRAAAALALGLALGTSALGQKAVADPNVFPYPTTTRKLDNGLNVVLVPFDSPGIVAYYTIVRAGSRNEVEPGKSGFAHFFEHMMFRGTERFSTEQYNAVFRELGSDANAYTSDDVTVYHALLGKDGLERVIDLESDRFMNLKYSESDFKQESKAVLGEYNKNYSDPENKLYEKMRETAFTTHTYQHTTMGFLADIQDMPNQYAYSLEFFRRFYTPANCVVLVVGDIDVDATFKLIQRYYGPWKVPAYEPKIPTEPEQTTPKSDRIAWENATLPQLAVAFKIPAYSAQTRDSAALDILFDVVFGETSPLYQDLVIREQKVEELYAYGPFRRDPGLVIVFTKVKDVGSIDQVRERIFKAVDEAAKTPVDATRLVATKSNIRYSFAMSLDTARSVAGHLTRFIGLTGDPATINDAYRRYDEVTAEDLMRVAGTYLTRPRSTEITLTGGAQ